MNTFQLNPYTTSLGSGGSGLGSIPFGDPRNNGSGLSQDSLINLGTTLGLDALTGGFGEEILKGLQAIGIGPEDRETSLKNGYIKYVLPDINIFEKIVKDSYTQDVSFRLTQFHKRISAHLWNIPLAKKQQRADNTKAGYDRDIVEFTKLLAFMEKSFASSYTITKTTETFTPEDRYSRYNPKNRAYTYKTFVKKQSSLSSLFSGSLNPNNSAGLAGDNAPNDVDKPLPTWLKWGLIIPTALGVIGFGIYKLFKKK